MVSSRCSFGGRGTLPGRGGQIKTFPNAPQEKPLCLGGGLTPPPPQETFRAYHPKIVTLVIGVGSAVVFNVHVVQIEGYCSPLREKFFLSCNSRAISPGQLQMADSVGLYWLISYPIWQWLQMIRYYTHLDPRQKSLPTSNPHSNNYNSNIIIQITIKIYKIIFM